MLDIQQNVADHHRSILAKEQFCNHKYFFIRRQLFMICIFFLGITEKRKTEGSEDGTPKKKRKTGGNNSKITDFIKKSK